MLDVVNSSPCPFAIRDVPKNSEDRSVYGGPPIVPKEGVPKIRIYPGEVVAKPFKVAS